MSLNLIWKVENYLRNIYDLGQGQAPTNWIREPRHDLIAFPELYSYGIGGVNFERLVKLCKTDFFSVKFLNRNKMYAKNSDYLFVCQQFLERHLLESNISVKAQKGKVQKGPDGTKIISCDNLVCADYTGILFGSCNPAKPPLKVCALLRGLPSLSLTRMLEDGLSSKLCKEVVSLIWRCVISTSLE